MKKLFFVIFWCCVGSHLAFGQGYVSPTSHNYKPFAMRMIGNAKTKLEKVKAIYDWMCENIRYDTSYSIYTADECFNKRKGVCQAYSELMYRLCEAVGVKCTIISGIARHQYGGGGHAWICAEVEGRSILIDPTWGAGHVNGNKFTFREDHSYWFDVDPYWMIFTHLPNNKEHQFIYSPIDESIFNRLPRISPDCKYFGWNARDIFMKCLRQEITSLPHFYGVEKQIFQFADIPLQKTLQVGHTYKFRIKVADPRRISIIANDQWYKYEDWTNDGEYISIFITPSSPGDLNLSYKKDDGWYGTIVKYEVR